MSREITRPPEPFLARGGGGVAPCDERQGSAVPRGFRAVGVSDGDGAAVQSHGSPLRYVLDAAIKSALRLAANHCIIPSLRVWLFRLSGIRVGKRTQINQNTIFLDDFCGGMITLEDAVAVGPLVSFVAASHANDSPLAAISNLARRGPIIVKRGAWLGVGAVIMPGVTVGTQAIVGANAVVTRDVDDYAIVVGVPARKVGDIRERIRDEAT